MVSMKYLKEEHRKGFDNYKYCCLDTSYLSQYVMHPFWNWCVQFFPRWIAPNLITFVGFLLITSNFFLIGVYDFNFTAANNEVVPIPNWVWIVAALNIFVAYTLDGIDGKQARRTGTSSPLGELFDHGVDSYSAGLIPIYMFSIFGTTQLSPLRMFFINWNVYLNFYLTHFEKYNTGILYLPWAYDFTMWGVTITLLITGFFGANIWRFTLPYGITAAVGFELLLYLSGIISSHPFIVYRILVSYRKRTGKMRPFTEAIRPLIPFVSMFVITTIWVVFSQNDICANETRILFLLFGTVFSNICCRLIVAQMSDTRAAAWNLLLWPLVLVTIITTISWHNYGLPRVTLEVERYIVYILATVTTAAHIHYGKGIVCEMCDHFKIRCFKIPPPSPQTINL